jgi:hypothetical protein
VQTALRVGVNGSGLLPDQVCDARRFCILSIDFNGQLDWHLDALVAIAIKSMLPRIGLYFANLHEE